MQKLFKSTNLRAILWTTIGTGLFSIVFASGKLTGDAGSATQILFLRYLSGFFVLVLITFFKGRGFKPYYSDKPLTHLLRAFMGAFGGSAMIYAAANMPLIDATAIGLLQAVFVIALGVMMLGEHLTPQKWAGIVICCIGSVMIVGSKGAFLSMDVGYIMPAGVALIGAALVAFEGIMIKKLSMTEKFLSVLLYVNGFSMVLLSIPAYLTWQSVDLSDNTPFIMLGPLAITAQYFILKGYQLADVSLLGAIDYTWLIFAGIIGYLFFAEIPTLVTVLGSIVIVLGGIVLALVGSKSKDQA